MSESRWVTGLQFAMAGKVTERSEFIHQEWSLTTAGGPLQISEKWCTLNKNFTLSGLFEYKSSSRSNYCTNHEDGTVDVALLGQADSK